jgi:hypothetical protein
MERAISGAVHVRPLIGMTARRHPSIDHSGLSALQRRRRAQLAARNAGSARVLADLLLHSP